MLQSRIMGALGCILSNQLLYFFTFIVKNTLWLGILGIVFYKEVFGLVHFL